MPLDGLAAAGQPRPAAPLRQRPAGWRRCGTGWRRRRPASSTPRASRRGRRRSACCRAAAASPARCSAWARRRRPPGPSAACAHALPAGSIWRLADPAACGRGGAGLVPRRLSLHPLQAGRRGAPARLVPPPGTERAVHTAAAVLRVRDLVEHPAQPAGPGRARRGGAGPGQPARRPLHGDRGRRAGRGLPGAGRGRPGQPAGAARRHPGMGPAGCAAGGALRQGGLLRYRRARPQARLPACCG